MRAPKLLTLLSGVLLSGVLFGLPTGCKPPPLEWTKGHVNFAKNREAFYDAKWQGRAKANQPRICAGFVHKKAFGHYLKYGQFKLHMTMEVLLGGTGVYDGTRYTQWQGGKVLRSIKRKIRVGQSNNSYVWCGRLQGGGRWKVGALRLSFILKGAERSMDESIATGILRIIP